MMDSNQICHLCTIYERKPPNVGVAPVGRIIDDYYSNLLQDDWVCGSKICFACQRHYYRKINVAQPMRFDKPSDDEVKKAKHKSELRSEVQKVILQLW